MKPAIIIIPFTLTLRLLLGVVHVTHFEELDKPM